MQYSVCLRLKLVSVKEKLRCNEKWERKRSNGVDDRNDHHEFYAHNQNVL